MSVFRDYDRFAAVNPVVKAPTLVTDEGVVLLESTLILDHLERWVADDQRLAPRDPLAHARHQRIVGLALAACDKTVQLVYERDRPKSRRHEPWLRRVRTQLAAAYALLEAEMTPAEDWLFGDRPTQADVSAAVAWSFTRLMAPGEADALRCPRLEALARAAEGLRAFSAYPMR
jgi:glutathione S-transferase